MTRIEQLEWTAKYAVKSRPFSSEMFKSLLARLNQELDVVRKEECAEMFLFASALFAKARKARCFFELSPAGGLSLSLLCYLLDISVDNPLIYPEHNSFSEFGKELLKHKILTILISGSGLTEMGKYIKSTYPDAEIIERSENLDAIIPGTDDYASFRVHATLDYESARRERVLDSIISLQMNRINLNIIPLNDEAAYELFNSLDWDGVTDNLVFTKVMCAVKEKKPHSIRGIWDCINTPVYQVYGKKEDEQLNIESYAKAIRLYHLAYLKAHFKEAFNTTLETERIM